MGGLVCNWFWKLDLLLGNARFERAAFGSGGRRRVVPATLALRPRGLLHVQRQLPGGLELDFFPLGDPL